MRKRPSASYRSPKLSKKRGDALLAKHYAWAKTIGEGELVPAECGTEFKKKDK